MQRSQVIALILLELIFFCIEIVNVLSQEFSFGVNSDTFFKDFHCVLFLKFFLFLLFFESFEFLKFSFFLFVVKSLLGFEETQFSIRGNFLYAG